MCEGEMSFFAMLSYPEHSLFVRMLCLLVDDISGEVKIFGYIELKATTLGLVVGHIGGLRGSHKKYSFRHRTLSTTHQCAKVMVTSILPCLRNYRCYLLLLKDNTS